MLLALLMGAPAFALQVGDQAPDAKLKTAAGQTHSLSSYAKSQKKKNLLLLFFRTGTCGVCVGQLAEYAAARNDVHRWNAAIGAVSLDDAIVQKSVSEKLGEKFPIWLDPDAKMVKTFGTLNPNENLSHPAVFLLGPDRKVLYRYVGTSLTDRPTLDTVMAVVKHYSGLNPEGTGKKAK